MSPGPSKVNVVPKVPHVAVSTISALALSPERCELLPQQAGIESAPPVGLRAVFGQACVAVPIPAPHRSIPFRTDCRLMQQ
jgi:hypothetical protein